MLIPALLIIVSIGILYYGAEFSLDASEKIGSRLGLSPLVIGMLLIGFGTSLPELFVGHIAAFKGKNDIAVGSLVGSNIANMLLILGLCGLFTSLPINTKSIKEHLWVHLLLCIALGGVLYIQKINFISMVILLAVAIVYMFFIYKDMDRTYEEHGGDIVRIGNPAKVFIKFIFGLSFLYVGGELLVKGGTDICTYLGVSEYIISAIFIAFGTSFPELVTALIAAIKKKDTDLIVGNIVGSNLFNCSLILGSLGIYEFQIPTHLMSETIALMGGGLVLVFFAHVSGKFTKFPAIMFLVGYGVIVFKWASEA